MDPQGQLGKALGVETRRTSRSAIDLLLDNVLGESPRLARSARASSPLPISPTRITGLDVVVANKSLALFSAIESGVSLQASQRLSEFLAQCPEAAGYDFVLFDAPPSFGPLTLNVLCAATEVVIPVPLTYLALDGCAELVRTLALVRGRYGNRDLRIALVVPTFYRRTKLAHEILEKLKSRFRKEISQTVVGYHVRIDEAQSRGLSIFEYAPNDRGAKVMAEIAEELEMRGAAPDETAETAT
jgi:chromosome partitioning protein